jgi:hypothetical protein
MSAQSRLMTGGNDDRSDREMFQIDLASILQTFRTADNLPNISRFSKLAAVAEKK